MDRRGAIAIGSLIAACVGVVVLTQRMTPGPSASAQRHDAIALCEVTVPSYLKSGSADHFANEAAIGGGGETWTVSGTVYATNSFNAVVPSAFTCNVARGAVTSVAFP